MRVPVSHARPAAEKHRCPAPTCRIWVPMHRLGCSTHWYSLPEQLRNDLNATYRRDRRRHIQLYREAVRLLAQTSIVEGANT